MIPKKLLEGFKYRIDLLSEDESAILKWPEIAAHAEVFVASDMNEDPEIVIRYLILMYTPGSPAIAQHPHVGKRKTWVMGLLGIQPDEKGQYPEYNDMLLVRGTGMRKRLVTYLMVQHSMDWAIMCHAQEELETLMESTVTRDGVPVDPEVIMKTRKAIKETRDQMEAALMRITAAEKLRAIDDAIEFFLAQRNTNIRQEKRILALPDAGLPQDATQGKSLL